MPRLVVLSEGLTGRSHELKAEKTTVGRVEDNSFQVPDGSVSSHHCEIILKGNDVLVKDLDSTNGTFIGDKRITEAILKPSQVLRLGQIEIRLEGNTPATAPKKQAIDHTQIIPQGIKLNELDQTARLPVAPAFEKKSNTATKVFIAVIVVVAILIVGFVIYIVAHTGSPGQ